MFDSLSFDTNINISEENVESLVGQVDLVVDCAPLFKERFSMNSEAVRQGKPIIECAMYELEAQISTIIPGKTACLSCLYPTEPTAIWCCFGNDRLYGSDRGDKINLWIRGTFVRKTPHLRFTGYDFSQGEHSTQIELSGLRQTLISCMVRKLHE